LSSWEEQVPDDFEMNAISIGELKYILDVANSRRLTNMNGGEDFDLKKIKYSLRLDIIYTDSDSLCLSVEWLNKNLKAGKRIDSIKGVTHYEMLFDARTYIDKLRAMLGRTIV
jgi:hypothetical protein